MGKKEVVAEVLDVAVEGIALTADVQDIYDPLRTGFVWYQAPLATETEHRTGGHSWNIVGHDMQVLAMSVPAGSNVQTEIGSFMYMSPFMETEVELTLCGKGGCSTGCNRICGGESCVKMILKNETPNEGYVGLTPNFPAKILPVKFGTHVTSGSKLIAKPGAYMSQLGDVDVGCDLDCSPVSCCGAGFGFCRQKMTGPDDSIAFLAAAGTLVFRRLEAGETITVDSNSVVAFEESVTIGLVPNCGCCNCCFGGEGCFSTSITGPGRIYFQSYSFEKFKAVVAQAVMDR